MKPSELKPGTTVRVLRIGNRNRTTFQVEKIYQVYEEEYPSVVFQGRTRGNRTHFHILSASELANAELLPEVWV